MKRKRGRRIVDRLMLLLLVIGIGLFSYPFISDALNNYLDQQIIAHYQAEANQENAAAMAKMQEQIDKNQKLAKEGGSPGLDPFSEAEKIRQTPDKSYFESHTIGVLTIPKINVQVPIFDKTNSALLEKGSSLLEGTSFPTGGKNTHAVISGHRGLPQAKLFTDLPELQEGEEFYLEVYGETLVYQVDQIKTVVPTDTQDLQIESGKDLVTLLTCTPYMINSHRLLVRGHRIPYHPEVTAGIKKVTQQQQQFLWMLLLIAFGFLIFGIWWFKRRKKKNGSTTASNRSN
ncbi:class C sortase [Enterococcus sp.]|uniref:class C sortase n=1 Tax=Enterococcus sp. TaxID=35783 RepID=UPI0025B96722|nr:class C sortase [Enterococcus sp.]